MDFSALEKSIGYTFKDKNLLKNALTHTSYAYENKVDSNEKLEFLGDSILEFLSSKYIYNNYTKLKEGEIACKHNFSDFLYLGKSQKANEKEVSPAILADSVEAVIAAIYFDAGLAEAEKFIVENLKDAINIATMHVGMKDYKTVLQEKLQIHGTVDIKYNIVKEFGPDHDKNFVAEVLCDGKFLAEGTGKNKKMAEMEAAKKALENM